MRRLLFAAAAVLVSAVVLPLACAPVYEFPQGHAFTGAQWLSPYRGGGGPWCRINLHAHSYAWGGLTNGVRTADEVHAVYRDAGTGAWAVSNYFSPEDGGAGGLRAYEHGYNVSKAHRLMVEPHGVDLFDAVVPTLNFKQYQLDRLAPKAGALVVTHPWWERGHGRDVLTKVTGLRLLEVVSHYGRGDAQWDAALSTGRLLYGVGGDDTHDALSPQETGVAWTQVHAPCSDTDAIVKALRAGDAYAVDARAGPAPVVEDVKLAGNLLRLVFSGEVGQVKCLGPGGEVREVYVPAHRTEGGETDAGTEPGAGVLAPRPAQTAAFCSLPTGDGYLRVVATGVGGGEVLLNPIVRWDGVAVPELEAEVRPLATWAARLAWLGLAALAWVPVVWRRRRPAPR